MDPFRDLDSVDVHMQFVNDVLKKLHALCRNCLDFQSISPHLRSHDLLTNNEWELISKKDSREQQVDEFLKCLPHKGRNCLSQLIKCLQLSPEHSGHKDILAGLNKLVEKQTDLLDNSTAEIFNDPDPQGSFQDEFEKAITECASTIKSAHLAETNSLKQKIEEQKTEIRGLQLSCSNHTTTIQQLRNTISDLQDSNEYLKAQLQEKEMKLENLSSSTVTVESDVSFENVSFTSCEEENAANHERVGNSSYSNSSTPEMHQKKNYLELPNQHPKVTRTSSIEEKMKAYQEKLKIYYDKCESLQAEKESLKCEKCQLEWEVSSLKKQLDTVSIASHSSSLGQHKNLSHSCSSLYERTLADQSNAKCESDKNATSVFSRVTAIMKIPVKRTSKFVSPEPQSMDSEISNMLCKDTKEGYLTNPINKGWLIKEGGHKKSFRKRWCILSSQFFYFEKEDDLKRPLGILYLTPDMEVIDSTKENCFEIYNKSRTNLKSCKLDKNRINYVTGNHASYHLQASCDDDKKKWIEAFQKVFESLKLK